MFKLVDIEPEEVSKPTWIDIYYSRRSKMWVAILRDEKSNEHESFYGTKAGCELTEKEWEEKYSIDHKSSLKARKDFKIYLEMLR